MILDSSLFCPVDELDLDGNFPLILLIFNDLSTCMLSSLFGWILVELDFLIIVVKPFLRFSMSEQREFYGRSCNSSSYWCPGWTPLSGLYFKLLNILNLRFSRIILADVSVY